MDDSRQIRDLAGSKANSSADSHSVHPDIPDFGGTFRITEYHDLQIARPRFGSLEASLICHWEAQSGSIFTALKLTHKGQDEYDIERSEVISEDEVRDLKRVLAFLSDRKEQITKGVRTYTEIKYELESGLILGKYIDGDTDGEYCVIEGETVFLRSLEALGSTLDQALQLADTIKRDWNPC